jgi:hypothetical protein
LIRRNSKWRHARAYARLQRNTFEIAMLGTLIRSSNASTVFLLPDAGSNGAEATTASLVLLVNLVVIAAVAADACAQSRWLTRLLRHFKVASSNRVLRVWRPITTSMQLGSPGRPRHC